jgi:hypothetical protein
MISFVFNGMKIINLNKKLILLKIIDEENVNITNYKVSLNQKWLRMLSFLINN